MKKTNANGLAVQQTLRRKKTLNEDLIDNKRKVKAFDDI